MDLPEFVKPINRKLPILIIDKQGLLGTLLAKKLREQYLIVLVSGREFEVHANIIHIPYRKKIPSIPDNTYSHIFAIYSGEEELIDVLPALARKASDTHAKLFFITQLFYSSGHLMHFLNRQEFLRVQLVLYGDIFDDALTVSNSVSVFIEQMRKYQRLSIPEQGLGYIYPIHLDDILDAIIFEAFAKAHHKLLYLFPKVAFTQLSIARIFQRIDPLLKMDFTRSKRSEPDYYIPPYGVYYFPQYDLEKRLRTINLQSQTPVSSRRIRVKKRRAGGNIPIIAAVTLLCFLLVPLFISVVSGAIGGALSAYALKQAESGKLTSAVQLSALAANSFEISQTLTTSLVLLDVLGQNNNFTQMITDDMRLVQTENQVFGALNLLSGLYKGTSRNPHADFLTALTSLKNSFIMLQKFQAEGVMPKQVLSKIQQVGIVTTLFENTSDALPTLLGFNGQKTYLVLFQNNMELRPGGGFIGSYGIATVNNGKLGSFTVSDVYDADGKMNMAITPPFALQRYLGATHWFLRDSNYDVDFERDAATATSLLQDETGQRVDGVIAIDTDFLKMLLSDFGPVYVPDYNLTVTPANFYQITESQSEDGFFPGSSQKKAFLNALFTSLMLHIQEEGTLPVVPLLQTIGDAVMQKHLLFSFSDQAVQKLFTVNDLSGSLWDDRSTENNTFPDTLGVIDANLGANKANLYIKRTIEQEATVMQSGELQEKVTVSYQNFSNAQSPFGGNYKDYVRLLVPINAQLQDIAINGQIVQITPAITDPAIFTAPGFVPPSQLEIETSQEEGKTLFGLLLLVPTGATKTISITYVLSHAVDTTQPAFTYDLHLFKQPGAQNDPYSLLLAYPANFTPVITDGMGNVGGKLAYNSTLSQDQDMVVEFSKQ